jgi:hypothetical protein
MADQNQRRRRRTGFASGGLGGDAHVVGQRLGKSAELICQRETVHARELNAWRMDYKVG